MIKSSDEPQIISSLEQGTFILIILFSLFSDYVLINFNEQFIDFVNDHLELCDDFLLLQVVYLIYHPVDLVHGNLSHALRASLNHTQDFALVPLIEYGYCLVSEAVLHIFDFLVEPVSE